MKSNFRVVPRCMRNLFAVVAVLGAVGGWLCPQAYAQMVSGSKMAGYADVFGVVLDQRSYPYSAKVVSSNVPGSILWPGEQPEYVIQIANNTGDPIQGDFHVSVIPFGTRGIPGDIWKPQVERIGAPAELPIALNIAAHGHQNVALKPTISAKYGAYALVADLGPLGRQFVTTLVRTFKVEDARIQYPSFCLDDLNVDLLKRLGVHAIRYGMEYRPTTSKDFDAWYAGQKARLDAYNAANISVLVMIGAGTTPMPLGMPRPWLDDTDTMKKTKSDYAWLPSSDPDFEQFCHKVAADFGWPKGPVNAFSLWNEPWDGISIAGWGADSIRYRELYTRLAHGVDAARKQDGVDVLIGGCDSSSNALDKLFADGKTDFLDDFDFVSIHYQGVSSYANVKMWADRQNPRGRVRIWDTESWVANTDDRVAAVVAGDRAAGYDRAMGVYGGNIQSDNKYGILGDDNRQVRTGNIDAWPVAAAVGAATHFIGERPFKQLLFPDGLPWVMVFDGLTGASGKPNADDGTVVVVGDLGEEFGADWLPLRTARGFAELRHKSELKAKLAALPASATDAERAALQKAIDTPETLSDATMTLRAESGFSLYDYYGNPVPATNREIVVPLDGRGFFLRADGSKGSFDRLIAAIRAADIRGIEPVAIVAHDMTAPLESHPAVKITLTNVLNKPVKGSLSVKADGLNLAVIPDVALAPSETRDVLVPVTGGAAAPNNAYSSHIEFRAGTAGTAVLDETLHANVIAHRTITVDGKLDDWKDVLPQVVVPGGSGPTLTEAAWFPFKKFDTNTPNGISTGYMAYDDKNFYFAAKVADDTPDPGMVRMATRNDDDYFYPAVSYLLNTDAVLQKKDSTWTDAPADKRTLQNPADPKSRVTGVWESTVAKFAVDLSLPKTEPHRVALYLVDGDDLGRRSTQISVIDKDTGKELDTRNVESYKLGDYVVYLLSGNVRIVLAARNWLSAPLSGIFFDAAPAGTPTPSGTSAKFVTLDLTTQGDWKGVYGTEGYNVVGAPASYPSYAAVDVPEHIEKTPLTWPAGVRRFTYRKAPELPSGNAPKHDNVQIAFNVLPPDQKPWYPSTRGTMPGFINYKDTDYEYALNPIAPQYGGGVEIWRLDYPGMPRKQFYPRQPKSPLDGAVNGQLVVVRDGNTRIVEAAIPWGEIPEVRKRMLSGTPIKFSFRVNDDKSAGTTELSRGRSVAKRNASFHADWVEHWANEVEFGWEK